MAASKRPRVRGFIGMSNEERRNRQGGKTFFGLAVAARFEVVFCLPNPRVDSARRRSWMCEGSSAAPAALTDERNAKEQSGASSGTESLSPLVLIYVGAKHRLLKERRD
jgi:hypothetical protein